MTANDPMNDLLERVAYYQMQIICPGAQGIQVIKYAFAYMPFKTISAECPFFVNRVKGDATNFQASMGLQRIPSTVEMALCVVREQGATNLEDAQAEVLRWRMPVIRMFAAHIRLGGIYDWLMEATISKYEPFREFKYGEDQVYLASMFSLKVIESANITIGI